MRTLLLTLLTLIALPASALSQTYVYNKTGFFPTSFHEHIYEMMERCTGISGDFSGIQWSVAQMILINDPLIGDQARGMWTEEGGPRQIILNREFAFDGPVVSHEILHDLYRGSAPMDVAQACVLDWTLLHFKEEEGGGNHHP